MKAANLIAPLVLTGCVAMPPGGVPDAPTALAQRQDAPRLAILEHVLARYFTADITDPPTVCAAVHDGREEVALPTSEEVDLIERFPRLAPMSRCSLSPAGWVDDESGEPAMVFSLHGFTCPSTSRCTGWAGYRSSPSTSMSELYTAEWRGGAWQITRDPALIAQ